MDEKCLFSIKVAIPFIDARKIYIFLFFLYRITMLSENKHTERRI